MSHKSLVRIAVVMVIVFGAMVVLYPLLFSPESATPMAVPAAPVGP